MTIAVYSYPDCLKHDTGPLHPENAERLLAILNALENCEYKNQLEFLDAPLGKDEDILLAHTHNYLDTIKENAPLSGSITLDDGDTVMSEGSLDAAYRAAGAACASVDTVTGSGYTSAFCAVRPPGHHATRTAAMGFCIFNNIAIAALYALKHKKFERVAIVDFDVHHGNGTQDIVQEDKRIHYISTHQSPFYPCTGAKEDKGIGGNIINVELPAGTNGEDYRAAFRKHVLPALESFKPELLLISAGFDGHKDDPLANMNLTEDDYQWIGEQLSNFAQNFCNSSVVSMLEGGYNHKALAASVVAYLRPFV